MTIKGDYNLRGITMALDKNKIKGECLNGAYSELSSVIGINSKIFNKQTQSLFVD